MLRPEDVRARQNDDAVGNPDEEKKDKAGAAIAAGHRGTVAIERSATMDIYEDATLETEETYGGQRDERSTLKASEIFTGYMDDDRAEKFKQQEKG